MNMARRQFTWLLAGAAAASTVSRVIQAQTTSLDVLVWGSGPRVVFVHGSIFDGPATWKEQRPLGDRWRLEIFNRRGYGKSPPPAGRSDFEQDARDIVELLGGGAHLVGHSYGAIVTLYAAALRPQAVRSLAVNEPPAWHLLKGDPAADAMIAGEAGLDRSVPPRAFLEAFIKMIAAPGTTPPALPDPLPPGLEEGVRTTMGQRPPGEAEIPIAALKQTSFPKLVTSGGHNQVFENVCDLLQRELKAERAIIRGVGHRVPNTGAPFNERLEALWKTA
jgi:pimeloyl-ACP methyl ester carboxylesterase